MFKEDSAHSQLRREYDWFMNHHAALKEQYPQGGHAVVRLQELYGVWVSRDEAHAQGLKAFGNVPFLVRSIFEKDAYKVYYSTHTSS